jgi:hypothetical protein
VGRQALLRETLALFLACPASKSQTLALLGLLQDVTRASNASNYHTLKVTSRSPVTIKSKTFHLKWVIPPRLGSTKVSWVERPSFLHVQRLILSLSCLCHPNNHLMDSSAPWRSELIISPCVPVHWYLSVRHGLAHQKLRPPWAH